MSAGSDSVLLRVETVGAASPPPGGVSDDDLKWLGSSWITPKDLARLAVEHDRGITV